MQAHAHAPPAHAPPARLHTPLRYAGRGDRTNYIMDSFDADRPQATVYGPATWDDALGDFTQRQLLVEKMPFGDLLNMSGLLWVLGIDLDETTTDPVSGEKSSVRYDGQTVRLRVRYQGRRVRASPAAVTLLALGRALGRARVRGASLPRQLALDAPERRPLLSWAPASPTRDESCGMRGRSPWVGVCMAWQTAWNPNATYSYYVTTNDLESKLVFTDESTNNNASRTVHDLVHHRPRTDLEHRLDACDRWRMPSRPPPPLAAPPLHPRCAPAAPPLHQPRLLHPLRSPHPRCPPCLLTTLGLSGVCVDSTGCKCCSPRRRTSKSLMDQHSCFRCSRDLASFQWPRYGAPLSLRPLVASPVAIPVSCFT